MRDLRIWIEPHGLVIDVGTSSYYDKQMAQHLVRELSGLGVADNRIVVSSLLESIGDDIGRHLVIGEIDEGGFGHDYGDDF